MNPVDVFYRDVAPVLAQQAVSRLCKFQSYPAVTQELTEVAWKTIPSTDIICEPDNALPLFVQELSVQRAERVLGSKPVTPRSSPSRAGKADQGRSRLRVER
jgi:hypothetical protein